MFKRNIEKCILDSVNHYRALTLVGPRQSGKTTLAKKIFPQFEYFSFENPDIAEIFHADPRGFLSSIEQDAIFDEVQKVPQLLSYLQEILDNKKDKRKFILTGSNNLKLSSKVSQSLAGRTRILQILPLQWNEIPAEEKKSNLDHALFFGSFPRIYDEKLNPTSWLGDYLQTYIEKDLRESLNVGDLKSFNNFLRLLAGRVGSVVNFSSLGSDASISSPTVKNWISTLESTYICFTLSPHFKNFNKRLTKSPKIYFYDTGLLCYLLRIKNIQQLKSHPLRGAIFENWVILEYYKKYFNLGEEAPLYFWRDQHGHEVDLVIDEGEYLNLVEIKSGQTFHNDFTKNIDWINQLQKRSGGEIVYGGDKSYLIEDKKIIPWNEL